jgi:hypothetical protein
MSKQKKKKIMHEHREEEIEIFDLVEQWLGLDDPENLEKSVYAWTGYKITPRKESPKITA